MTQPSAQRFYAHLARLIRPYRWDFSIGLLATAAASGLAVLIPLAFRGGVDGVVQHGRAAPLLLYGLAVILLTIGKGWGDYLAYQRIAGMGQRIAYDLRNRIFTHLQSLPPAFFDQANTGDIMSRATSDVEGVRMFINWSLSSFLEMVFLFIAAFVLMSIMSWQLTLLVSAMFPLLGYAVMRFRRRLRPRYLAVQEQYGRMTTALQENLAGIRLIQAYCQEQSETARFRAINLELFRRAMAAAWERAIYLPTMFCLGSAAGGMVLWFGGSQVMSGRLTLGELVAFIFLFSASVEHNLTLGDPASTREGVRHAARLIGTDRLVEALPQGLDTPIFERGANLSVGEKQLLSLTRALAHDPAILILDEATSGVDGETDALIQDGLRRLLAQRTALVIAHRLSTIREMDRILVLDYGRIAEQGTHEQLLARRGLYAKLYRLQFAADAMDGPAPSPRATSLNDTSAISASIIPSLAPRR